MKLKLPHCGSYCQGQGHIGGCDPAAVTHCSAAHSMLGQALGPTLVTRLPVTFWLNQENQALINIVKHWISEAAP